MNQKRPCGAKLVTAGLMKYVQGELEEQEYKAVLNDSDTNYLSHRSQGCHILSQSLWMELTEAEGSKDSIHNHFLFHMYNGHTVTLDHLKMYQLYNAEALKKG